MQLKKIATAIVLAAAASSGFALDLDSGVAKDTTTGIHQYSWNFNAGAFDTALLTFSATLPGHVTSVYFDTAATQLAFDTDNGVWQYAGAITGGAHNVTALANGKLGQYSFAATLSNGAVPTFTQTTPAGITAAVPEPETYAMMLAGLGAVGFMARRRKSAAKV